MASTSTSAAADKSNGDDPQNETTALGETETKRWLWLAALLFLVFLLGFFPVVNGDIWWHLRTGQLILERGQVPDTDWFTYTNPDAKWTDLHWGFQGTTALLFSLGGVAALVVWKCLLGVGCFALGLSASDKRCPAWLITFAWLPTLLIFSGRYYVRPEIVSLFLLAGYLAVLHHSWQRPKLLWLIPVLQIWWVNTQGIFILGPVILGCFLAEWARRWLVQRESTIRWQIIVAISAATIVATLINPYGLRGAIFPLELLAKVRGADREFFFKFSGELAGLDEFVANHPLGYWGLFTNLSSGPLMLLFAVLVCTFTALAVRRQLDLSHLLLMVAFAYLTWQMRRNSVLFAVVGGFLLQQHVAVLWQTRKRGKESPWPAVGVAVLVVGLIVSVPTGFYYKLRQSMPARSLGWGKTDLYPHQAAQFLARPGMPRRIYAMNEAAAALCIFYAGPEQRVFADARLEMNTRETLTLYDNILSQLAADYSELPNSLRRGVDPDDKELPALLIDCYTLFVGSGGRPRLLAGLLEGEKTRWRCVFCPIPADAIPADERIPMSPRILKGGCVFLPLDKAQELNLPDKGEPLRRMLRRIRRN